MVKRVTEAFEQELEKNMVKNIKTYARTSGNPQVFARRVDNEVVNKARNGQYFKECEARRRMLGWDVEMEEYEKMRDKMEGLNPYLEVGYDSFAKKYFDFFGHGFRTPACPKGSPIMDNEYKPWICPHCFTKFNCPASGLPFRCRCGQLTPMGEYAQAKAYRR